MRAAARAGGCGQLIMGYVDLSLERDKLCRVASSDGASLGQVGGQRSRARRQVRKICV